MFDKCMLATSAFSNPELLEKCINSWYSDIYKCIIFDGHNSQNIFIDIYDRIKLKVNYTIFNNQHLGCSGSWNNIIKYCFDELNYDFLIMVGSDTEMQPGFLEDIIQDFKNQQLDFAVNSKYIFNCWIMNRKCYEIIGLWDENFFPAYFEDVDYRYRIKLSNIKYGEVGKNSIDLFSHYHSATIKCNSDFNEKNHKTFLMNGDYYIKKWGNNGQEDNIEIYKTPFNNPNLSIKEWTIDKYEYDRKKEIWRN